MLEPWTPHSHVPTLYWDMSEKHSCLMKLISSLTGKESLLYYLWPLGRKRNFSRCVVPGIATSHLPAVFSCQLLLPVQPWKKQLCAPFPACWNVIGSEKTHLSPTGRWLWGQGSFGPAKSHSKWLRGHMEREFGLCQVRCLLVGNKGCKGVRKGWLCRAAWNPSASSSFYCGIIHPAHSRRQ